MNIIIVKYKNPDVEEQCIESVKKYTDLKRHTLTVFDNEPENINLGKLWNQLIKESCDDVICLLNSDTLVEEGWNKMAEVLWDNSVGAVGPRTNRCGTNQKVLEQGEPEEINDLSGFCYIFTRQKWREVGGFPEDFPFYGQETVFNRKLQAKGYKLMCDRRVYIWHEKGSSWHKAKARGEMKMEQVYNAKFHYYNFLERLKRVQALNKTWVIMGAPDSEFPTYQGINQFVSDFGGKHLPMTANVEEIGEPDVLIVVQTRYEKQWYDTIKESRAKKKVLYFMDLRTPAEWNGDASIFDKVYLCAKGYIPQWEQAYNIPIEWLPQGTIQQPTIPKGESYRIVHIGGLNHNYHQNRMDIIKQLKNSVVQINECERTKRIKVVRKMYGIYGASDFALAISAPVDGYTSDRIYHVLGSGGNLLALDPGSLNHLHPYGNWFSTVEEARKIIDENKQVDRQKVFEYAQKNHLYKDRLIHILETYEV